MNPNSLLKRYAISASVWILTIINTTVFLVSRNSFWISHPGQAWLASGGTEKRTYLASEFERNLSCYAPGTCLRSGSALLSQTLINIIISASELTRVNLTAEQKTFTILIVGLLWRILCLAVFVFVVAKIFNSCKIGLLLGNGAIFLLSGLPLWQLGRVLTNLPFILSPTFVDRANVAFVHMSFGDLIFYDYGSFAIIPITALFLSKAKELRVFSSWKLFVVGLSVGSFYESFVPIIFLSLTIFSFLNKERPMAKTVWLLLGQLTWTISRIFTLRYTEAADPQSQFFIGSSLRDFFYYFKNSNKGISTTSSLPSVAMQLIIISLLAVILGFLISLIANRFANSQQIDQLSFQSISAVTLAVLLVIVGSFFRPVYIETGRQSLGLSIALVLFSFSYAQKLTSDRKLKFGEENTSMN